MTKHEFAQEMTRNAYNRHRRQMGLQPVSYAEMERSGTEPPAEAPQGKQEVMGRKALGIKGWSVPVNELPSFECNACGNTGRADELLAEDDNETLYCPRCETADWTWE